MDDDVSDKEYKYYSEVQKKQEEDVVYYLHNYRVPKYYKGENIEDDNDLLNIDFQHTDGNANEKSYYSYITNNFKVVLEQEDPYKICYDKNNYDMVNER